MKRRVIEVRVIKGKCTPKTVEEKGRLGVLRVRTL